MSVERGFLGKHRLPKDQRRRIRNEVLGFGFAGTLVSTALATGILYGADGVSTFLTNGANSGLHLIPNIPSSFQIPNVVDAGVNALGGQINAIPHANVLPNFAADHLSGVSSNPNFWGVVEGAGAFAATTKTGILLYEAGKRQLRHSGHVVGESLFPNATKAKKTVDSAHSIVKTGDALMKVTEIGTSFATPGSPIGINDLFGLAFVLTGYRPGKGIMTPADLLGMSVLLMTPLPTVTTWDILKGAFTRVTSAPKHVDTISRHVRDVRK